VFDAPDTDAFRVQADAENDREKAKRNQEGPFFVGTDQR
jgi:hypothetical protein